MTFWETVASGEYVMIALAVILIAVGVVWIMRGSRLSREKRESEGLMPAVRDNVMEGDIETAGQICLNSGTHTAEVVEAGLKQMGRPMPEVEAAMQKVSNAKIAEMRYGLEWLRLLAVVSPLIGLGGTLIGVTDRLRDLGESEVPVDFAILCSSIAPTIVTTVAGIVTGIIALISLTSLETQINSVRKVINGCSAEFIDLLNEPS